MSEITITTYDGETVDSTQVVASVTVYDGGTLGGGGGGSDVSLDADGTLIVDGLTVELATDAQLAAEAALARNADNLTSGTVADARIASTIARDSEVTAAVAAEATLARNADNLTSGTVADARIASTIARDSEVTAAANAAQAAAEATAAAALTAHAAASDPHPGYLTPAEGNAAYDAIGAAAAAAAASQPLDSDLTALAALTTTSFGRALLELANAAAGRAAFGLGTAATSAIGDFDAAGAAAAAQAASQPLDSNLTAIAALTTTSFGRGLLALADAAAGRTSLGLGTAATSASTDFQPIDSDLTAIAALTTTSYGRAVLELANQAALMALLSAASTTAQGIVELATSAETTTGTDTVRAVTPAGVKAVADTLAPLSHTHAASDIASGTIAAARLGSGSGGSTKFLREDSTWQTVSSGGGAVNVDTIWDTKGDLAVATGSDAASKLAVGTIGQSLTPDSSASTGLAYKNLGWKNYINDDLSSLTGWTQDSGTWSINGGVMESANGGAAARIKRTGLAAPAIAAGLRGLSVDMKWVSGSGSNRRVGLSFAYGGLGTASTVFYMETANGTTFDIKAEYDASSAQYDGADITYTAGNWINLTLVEAGGVGNSKQYDVHINGDPYTTIVLHCQYNQPMLYSYASVAQFKNLRAWYETAPWI